jgi:hypothetical protein
MDRRSLERGRFHLMSAKAHLMIHDPNRAMRHLDRLDRCMFGAISDAMSEEQATALYGPPEKRIPSQALLAKSAREREKNPRREARGDFSSIMSEQDIANEEQLLMRI